MTLGPESGRFSLAQNLPRRWGFAQPAERAASHEPGGVRPRAALPICPLPFSLFRQPAQRAALHEPGGGSPSLTDGKGRSPMGRAHDLGDQRDDLLRLARPERPRRLAAERSKLRRN